MSGAVALPQHRAQRASNRRFTTPHRSGSRTPASLPGVDQAWSSEATGKPKRDDQGSPKDQISFSLQALCCPE